MQCLSFNEMNFFLVISLFNKKLKNKSGKEMVEVPKEMVEVP